MRGLVDPKDALFWLGTSDAMPTDQYFVLAFDAPVPEHAPSWDEVCAHVKTRSAAIPALNKRLVESPSGVDYPVWVREEMSAEDCVTRLGEPDATWASCADAIAEKLESTVDATVTPWQMHVAERVRDVPYATGTCTVVLVRFSHVLTDGLGGAALLRALFGRTPRPADADVAAEASTVTPHGIAFRLRACGQAVGRLTHLLPAFVSVTGAGRRAAQLIARGDVVAPTPRARLSVNRCAESDRRVAVIPVPADLTRSSEFTVTQLALTAVSLATEKLLRDRGESADSLTAMMPVAFGPDAEWQGVNRFATGMVSMGGGADDLAARARTVRSSVTAERRRLAIPDIVKQFRLVETVPWPILRRVLRRRQKADPDQVAANLVFTSVNCGDGDMELLGSTAVMVAGFPCLSETLGIGIGLYGIGSALTLGVLTAPNAVGADDGYIELLESALVDVAGMVA
ncbi:wax ester/triacylglycerol synthase domain-containing protein [Williamsia phyllosphaerae]|uniref:Diacylglycerol O-acyltransferase n=1 Tax=Williamsia phyllosphaerae TaxID=885042 RepID=A0ABQ1UKS4_9NOCA|nr:wax ester/triacylglycerol synthase domain-containing protein [Williamsia phyllosphaerae]GGF19279.1 hypothetical protein GCM10007298_14180 [Williamsia phyllosphaerae]